LFSAKMPSFSDCRCIHGFYEGICPKRPANRASPVPTPPEPMSAANGRSFFDLKCSARSGESVTQ
jgi:hypothetical protein